MEPTINIGPLPIPSHYNAPVLTQAGRETDSSNEVFFVFSSPSNLKIRGLVFAITSITEPGTAVVSIYDNAVLVMQKTIEILDVGDGGDLTPYVLFSPSEYKKIIRGRRMQIGILAVGDTVFSVASSDIKSAFPWTQIASTKYGVAPILVMDYDTGRLDDFSQMITPPGCFGGTLGNFTNTIDQDYDALYPRTHCILNATARQVFARVGINPPGEGTNSFLLVSGEGPTFTLNNLVSGFDLAPFSGMWPLFSYSIPVKTFSSPDDATHEITLGPASAELMADLYVQRAQPLATDMRKASLEWVEAANGAYNDTEEPTTGVVPFLGSWLDAGVVMSTIEDAGASEVTDMATAIESINPAVVGREEEMVERSGFSPMVITPLDLMLAEQLKDVQE